MLTKKLTVLALCCLALFSSCEKDNDDTQKLETELAAEKSKTVLDIKKEGENLIIVYSNGTTTTVPYTDAIKGNIGGQNGKDGVGIESINFNPETGILAIKLTNGEVTEFRITGTGADWSAVLVGDANGSLFITEALLGSVPVIKAEYDNNYQLTYLESNRAVDMQTRKAFNVTRSYANGALDKYIYKEYATEDQVGYTSTWVEQDDSYSEVSFAEHKGQYFKTDNSDGTYTLYSLYNITGSESGEPQFNYRKYGAKAIIVSSGSPEYNEYEIIRKKSEKEFHYYQRASGWYGESENAYILYRIAIINDKAPIGSVISTKVVDVDTDSQGRITKQYEASSEGGEPTKYISYEHNTAGLVKTTKTYIKNAQGAWVANGAFETYNYNANNRLVSTILNLGDGTTREVQKAAYDKYGNPTEVWAWQAAVYNHTWGLNPKTGEYEYSSRLIREAGLYKVAMVEYDYTFKNFLSNTITALVPELEGYKIVNAIKRVTAPDSYSFANIEYKDFNEYGYPRRMKMDASENSGDFDDAVSVEVMLNYKVKSK